MEHKRLLYKELHFLSPTLENVVLYVVVYLVILSQRILAGSFDIFNQFKISNFYGTWIYSLVHKTNLFLGLNRVGETVLFGAWLIVGVVVYLIASFITSNVHDLASDVSMAEGHYVLPHGVNKYSGLYEFVAKFIIRFSTLVIGFFYSRLVVHIYKDWLSGLNNLHYFDLRAIVSGALLLVSVFVLLHIFTLLLRILLLRPRVFGSY